MRKSWKHSNQAFQLKKLEQQKQNNTMKFEKGIHKDQIQKVMS